MKLFKPTGKNATDIWYMDYTDAQGKRHRESTGTTNKKLADQIAGKRGTEILEQKKMGIKPIRPLLLSEFKNEYLKYSKTNKREKTTRIDNMALENFLKFKKDIFIDEVTEEDIEKYKTERKHNRGVSDATIIREMAVLNHFFNLAVKWKKIRHNPCEFVKKPKTPAGRVRYLTAEEARRLISECDLPYLRLFVVIALNTGMRKGEILGLKWENIDFENRLIHLEDSKSGERADIIMNTAVFDAVDNYPQEGENIFSFNDIKKSFKSALKRAGISNFNIHDLRHTFASHLIMNGVPLATVKDLMRHKEIAMTLRYAHLSKLHKEDAIQKLAGIWQGEN